MRKAKILGISLAALVAAMACALAWVVAMPGNAIPVPLPPDQPDAVGVPARMLGHVTSIVGERNYRRRDSLEAAAQYIEGQLRGMGYAVLRQEVPSKTGPVRNIEVRIPGERGAAGGTVVIGAHYDSADETPAANDNGSGVAALLELARAFTGRQAAPGIDGVRLVFFVNEEPPHFKTVMMGSWVYAAELGARKQKMAAMYALETMGAFYDAPGSQHYPLPGLSLIYPDRGNFLAYIGDIDEREAVRTAVGAFRDTRRLPSEGIAAPAFLEGSDWSDHWSFRQHGYPGVMVTDTALFRYEHYHMPEDTPEKIDYPRLAQATLGLRDMFERLYLQPKS